MVMNFEINYMHQILYKLFLIINLLC
jgi:hypothetical protein